LKYYTFSTNKCKHYIISTNTQLESFWKQHPTSVYRACHRVGGCCNNYCEYI